MLMLTRLGLCCTSAENGSLVENVDTWADKGVQTSVARDNSAQNVTYVSDVEGQWDYFCNFVEHSKGLSFVVEAEPEDRKTARDLELRLDEGWHFVHGGDACEKGPGSLRFLDAIVLVKKKYPKHVHLLLGSEDVRKLGWQSQLQGDTVGNPKNSAVTFWDRQEEKEENPYAFEQRRAEMAHLKGVSLSNISDQQVIGSFEESAKAGGRLREYLDRAQLGVLLGDALFVDGQVNNDAHKMILPGTGDDVETGKKELELWLKKLNHWCHQRVQDLDGNPHWDPVPRPGRA